MEDKAVIFFARSRNISPVEENGILHNGESKACTTQFAATPIVHSIEALEDARKIFERNAYTIVGKGEVEELCIPSCADGDGGVFACV